MSFLAYDLKAIEDAPLVARSANISEDAAIAGNARMWAWCWRSKTDVVMAPQITGFYGADATVALVAFGFLEELEPGRFRVKGAERYLRISRARSEAGKKGGAACAATGKNKQNLPNAEAIASGVPKQNSSNAEALPPNTEHRSKEEVFAAPPHQSPKPPKPRDQSPQQQFYAWAQVERAKRTNVPDQGWSVQRINTALKEPISKAGELQLKPAYMAYLATERLGQQHPPWPMWIFAQDWSGYVATTGPPSREIRPPPKRPVLTLEEAQKLYT